MERVRCCGAALRLDERPWQRGSRSPKTERHQQPASDWIIPPLPPRVCRLFYRKMVLREPHAWGVGYMGGRGFCMWGAQRAPYRAPASAGYAVRHLSKWGAVLGIMGGCFSQCQ